MKVRVRERSGGVRVEWRNSEGRQYTSQQLFLVAFWLFWAPVTCFVTWLAVRDGLTVFFAVWLTFGWIGTVLVPLQLVTALAVEVLEIDGARVRHRYRGLPLPRRTFATAELTRLVLDRVDDESVVTLNLYAGARREMIAFSLAPADKRRVFDALVPHLRAARPGLHVRDGVSG